MNENSDLSGIFNKFTIGVGGTLDMTILGPAQKYYESLLIRLREFINVACLEKNANKPIYLDYVHNTSFNAYAFNESDHDFIGLNFGLIELTRRVFLKIFSIPSCLPNIGNSSVENSSFEPWVSIHQSINTLVDIEDLALPVDGVRLHYAELCVEMAIRYVVAHEACHISNGHVIWLKRKSEDGAFFSENSNDNSKFIDSLTRQTLEWDADSCAVNRTLYILISRNKILLEQLYSQTEIPAVSREANLLAYGNIRAILFLFSFSTAVYRLIQDQVFWDEDILSKSTHPPNPVRNFSTLSILSDYPFITAQIDTKEARAISVDGLTQAIIAMSTVCGQSHGAQGILNAIEAFDYTNSLRKRWHSLRDELEPFARCNLAPKQVILTKVDIEKINIENNR